LKSKTWPAQGLKPDPRAGGQLIITALDLYTYQLS